MPGNFLTQSDADFTGSMDQVYFTSLWTARAAARRLLLSPPTSSSSSSSIPPKLVFTASILSFMSFAGYSSYAPAKYALRGLADSLRNELQWLGVDVHTFFPTGIRSPGFEVEEARKPEICKTVEGSDLPISPMQCAQHLLAGASSSRRLALQAGHSTALTTSCANPPLRQASRRAATTSRTTSPPPSSGPHRAASRRTTTSPTIFCLRS
jgi:NAD(P)-dependent dehydrogenase (short-subunit alcohol dehydrogenase family)